MDITPDKEMVKPTHHNFTQSEAFKHMFIMEHLDHQDTLILQILQRIEAQHTDLLQRISQLDPELAKRLGIDVQLASEDIIEASEDVSGNS